LKELVWPPSYKIFVISLHFTVRRNVTSISQQ